MIFVYFKPLAKVWLLKTSIIDNEPAQMFHSGREATDRLCDYSIFTTFVLQ